MLASVEDIKAEMIEWYALLDDIHRQVASNFNYLPSDTEHVPSAEWQLTFLDDYEGENITGDSEIFALACLDFCKVNNIHTGRLCHMNMPDESGCVVLEVAGLVLSCFLDNVVDMDTLQRAGWSVNAFTGVLEGDPWYMPRPF